MLNKTESCILNIFTNVYELKISNSINKNFKNMNIKFDEEHIPNPIINKFFIKTKNYTSNILEYALTYSLIHKFTPLINNFKELGPNINNIDTLDDETKRNILYNSIKFILSKRNNSILDYNIKLIKENNFNLYGHILGYCHIKTINNIYKEIIINIAKSQNKVIDSNFLEELLLSNKYDNLLIEISNNILKNKNDIKLYKLNLIRMILCYTYIIELNLVQQFISQHPDFTEESLVTTPELFFINYCIDNNHYYLPTDENVLKNMLNLFIAYNKANNVDKILNAEKNNAHILKKIYPLYIFDKLN